MLILKLNYLICFLIQIMQTYKFYLIVTDGYLGHPCVYLSNNENLLLLARIVVAYLWFERTNQKRASKWPFASAAGRWTTHINEKEKSRISFKFFRLSQVMLAAKTFYIEWNLSILAGMAYCDLSRGFLAGKQFVGWPVAGNMSSRQSKLQ